jgi:hypothetical protein
LFKRIIVLFMLVLLLGVFATPLTADPHAGRYDPNAVTVDLSEHPWGGDQIRTAPIGDVPWYVLYLINLPSLI